MIPFDLPPLVVLVALFVLGTLAGSFLNVCIDRFPRHEYFGEQIRSLRPNPRRRGLVPVLAWLRWARGWGSRHDRRYAVVEVLNGLLWAGLYAFEIPLAPGAPLSDSSVYSELGPQIVGVADLTAWMHWRYLYHLVLVEALLVASVIDLDTMLIPDGSTLPAMAAALVGAFLLGTVWVVPVWFEDPLLVTGVSQATGLPVPALVEEPLDVDPWPRPSSPLGPSLRGAESIAVPGWARTAPRWHGLAVSVAGLLVGGGVVWAVRVIASAVLRREAMGFGDVILMALIGSVLGWQSTLVVFFLAPICALAVVAVRWVIRRDELIPYGPYLSLGALVLLLAWQPVWGVARRFFALGLWVPVVVAGMGGMLAVLLAGIQLLKWIAGVPLYDEDEAADWTSADQLSHFAGEWADPQQGQWRRGDQWPGVLAARGSSVAYRWRHGPGGPSGQQQWRQVSRRG